MLTEFHLKYEHGQLHYLFMCRFDFSNGEGLYFDGDIQVGRSTTCDTYQNESLTCNESGDFSIIRLDVFGFL